jgi:rRNA-processing protein FCF1
MRPRPGVKIEDTLRRLREHVTEGRNIQSGGHNLTARRDRYLTWSHDVAVTLEYQFVGANLSRLHTDRYWRILEITSATPRPMEMINDEAELQVRRLEAIVKTLEEDTPNAPAAEVVAVPDTNALLHYRLFDEIKWRDVLGAASVRLAVPLRVVDELDAKKASKRADLADRAATVLKHLEQRLGTRMGQAVGVRDGVTVEIARPVALDEAYRHPADADTEVLDTCESLAYFATASVKVVTGDYGMRVRATARGIGVVSMPDEERLPASSG